MAVHNAAQACDLIIFGTKGDLARRKLLPSLYQLEKAGYIHPDTRIIGVGRAEWSQDDYVNFVEEALHKFLKEELDSALWEKLSARLDFCNLDVNETESFVRLAEMLKQDSQPAIHYFAMPPSTFGAMCQGLGHAKLNKKPNRVVMEKPLGTNLASSQEINNEVAKYFDESQVYRIDHYLGKETDTVNTYTHKIFESAMAGLDNVKHTLDISAINRAVDLLTQARKISFFGFGASAAVAHDAMNKFFRFNIPVMYFDDIVMQRMSCINSIEGDVIVLISHTGRTKALVDMAYLARENDATVIAITSENTPLAQAASLAIIIDVPEDTDMYMPMVSRMAQLAVIDVLTTGFTLRRGEKFRDNLKRVKEALRDSRFDNA